MYNKINVKNLVLKEGDILFESMMVGDSFYELINTSIVSTSFMFNVYKYSSEDIKKTTEDYIDHYLQQTHQDIFLGETSSGDEKEFRILNNSFYILVLKTDGLYVDTVKFSNKGQSRISTWNINNEYFHDHRFFQLDNIKNMYSLNEIKILWSDWVRENFQDILEGKVGGNSNLLF